MIELTDEYYVQAVHNLDRYNTFGVKEFARNNIQNTIGKKLSVIYNYIEVFDTSDDFFSFLATAQKIVDVLNFELFKNKNVKVIDELVQIRTQCESEPLIKMLALIGMIQEFFGVNVAANFYSSSDLRGVFEGSNSSEPSFMNIHMIHFFFQKGYMKEGLFSLYDNADLNDFTKLEATLNFGSEVYAKLESFLGNSMFDLLLVDFYSSVGKLKKMTNEEVSYFVNNSVANGCGAINPIALRLEELGFADVCS